jgi:cellulose synthase/poly-beta-1,6-N-acetylglucosamine synthase-like glycosyltransferase
MSDGFVEGTWALLDAYNLFILGYLGVQNLSYLLMTAVAWGALRRQVSVKGSSFLDDLIRTEAAPPVTLIAPAYNEEATCVDAVRALLVTEYPSFQVVVVNDGSKDQTMTRLVESFALERAPRFPVAEIPTAPVRAVWRSATHPDLWVVDKENGGKADALNAGLNYCRTPLFCAMDADSLLERDAVVRLSRAFVENVHLIAAGGTIRIANGCTFRSGAVVDVRLPRSWLARFQVLEYLRAFLTGRVAWDRIRSTLVISGAFGMFRRSAVVGVGGFATDTVGEDMELVVRLHRRFRERGEPYAIGFVPDPVAWTEAPETLRGLGRQRDRWQRGLIESLSRNLVMLFNPRYGRIGLLAYPYFLLFEMLGPVIEASGYVAFLATLAVGRASLPYALAFLSLTGALGVALSLAAVGLEEATFRRYPRAKDLLHLFWLAVVENFGYRQLAEFWRVRGVWSKLRGVRSWGEMERKGFRMPAGGGA